MNWLHDAIILIMSEVGEINDISTPEEATDSFIGVSRAMATGVVASEVGIAIGFGIFKAAGVDLPQEVVLLSAVAAGTTGMVHGVRGYYREIIKRISNKNS